MDSSSSTIRIEAGAPGTAASGLFASITASDMHGLSRLDLHHGKFEMERGAFAGLAFHADLSCMLLNDAVGDGESQASTPLIPGAVRSLGGEERVVDAINMFLRDAAAGIPHHDVHAIAVRSAHRQYSALRHGVFGVEEQIQKHLL